MATTLRSQPRSKRTFVSPFADCRHCDKGLDQKRSSNENNNIFLANAEVSNPNTSFLVSQETGKRFRRYKQQILHFYKENIDGRISVERDSESGSDDEQMFAIHKSKGIKKECKDFHIPVLPDALEQKNHTWEERSFADMLLNNDQLQKKIIYARPENESMLRPDALTKFKLLLFPGYLDNPTVANITEQHNRSFINTISLTLGKMLLKFSFCSSWMVEQEANLEQGDASRNINLNGMEEATSTDMCAIFEYKAQAREYKSILSSKIRILKEVKRCLELNDPLLKILKCI